MNFWIFFLSVLFVRHYKDKVSDVLHDRSLFKSKEIEQHKLYFMNESDTSNMFINSMVIGSYMNM